MLEITDSMRNNKFYDGNTRKFGITIDNVDYIVKFPKEGNFSVYSEYIASNFIQKLNISCHDVELGLYDGSVVNVIRDFKTGTDYQLHPYKEVKQSSVDTDLSTKEYTYNDVVHIIECNNKLTDKKEALRAFWNMFFCDAVIGNRDRHWGNWGYLKNDKVSFPSPLYDNGGGLFPDINRVISNYKTDRYSFIYDRVYKFPASLFLIYRDDKGRNCRTNYYNVCNDNLINDSIFNECLNYFKSINKNDIVHFIFDVVEDIDIDKELKRFYIEIVYMRFCCIILNDDFDSEFEYMEDLLCLIGM